PRFCEKFSPIIVLEIQPDPLFFSGQSAVAAIDRNPPGPRIDTPRSRPTAQAERTGTAKIAAIEKMNVPVFL
ncbi:MAG: hypothetical protein WCL32_09940, partial [Planctomycetota bacterium]